MSRMIRVSSINTLINNTGAGSDISLAIGRTAYVDVSAATSAQLSIATGDNQAYAIEIIMQGNTGSVGNVILDPNNTTYSNFFVGNGIAASGGSTGAFSVYTSGFLLAYAQDVRHAYARVSTKTISKSVLSHAEGINTTPTTYTTELSSHWQASASSAGGAGDTTTAWTSLGTVTFPVAATGRILITRIA